jgi:hypothetical protein
MLKQARAMADMPTITRFTRGPRFLAAAKSRIIPAWHEIMTTFKIYRMKEFQRFMRNLFPLVLFSHAKNPHLLVDVFIAARLLWQKSRR